MREVRAAKADAKPATEGGAEPRNLRRHRRSDERILAVPLRRSPALPKPDGFVVQLAAFADDKGANALANKLKKNGYSAYVEPVKTSRGTLWRVRVGGYGTRPEADVARVCAEG